MPKRWYDIEPTLSLAISMLKNANEEKQDINPFDAYNILYEEFNGSENDAIDEETFNKLLNGEIESDDQLALSIIEAAKLDEIIWLRRSPHISKSKSFVLRPAPSKAFKIACSIILRSAFSNVFSPNKSSFSFKFKG